MCKLRGNKKKQGNKVTGFNNNHTKVPHNTSINTKKTKTTTQAISTTNGIHTQKKTTLATTPNYKSAEPKSQTTDSKDENKLPRAM
jgi:hypothetical protein